MPIAGVPACPILTQAYNKCSAVAEMCDHWATIDMGRKLGAVPFWGSWIPK